MKGKGPRSLRETSLGCKTHRSLGKDLYLKGTEKECLVAIFFLNKYSKKRFSEAYSQGGKKKPVMFHQAERNNEAVSVNEHAVSPSEFP